MQRFGASMPTDRVKELEDTVKLALGRDPTIDSTGRVRRVHLLPEALLCLPWVQHCISKWGGGGGERGEIKSNPLGTHFCDMHYTSVLCSSCKAHHSIT